ncbi:hypothetical protein EMPS_11297 [Entomortierella parvispora]|uniref:Uncharacterized protein n=1 Tax=Entomortierella parvispora TaxID=205924 RepID=A0A9P3M2D4_9FUNG|nr:hypothetical protein EMPS_11269 [Entomortierella parvispora]GJJ78938.1 hypothetical protein EMPS_11297 [Entomortierella parvispora]
MGSSIMTMAINPVCSSTPLPPGNGIVSGTQPPVSFATLMVLPLCGCHSFKDVWGRTLGVNSKRERDPRRILQHGTTLGSWHSPREMLVIAEYPPFGLKVFSIWCNPGPTSNPFRQKSGRLVGRAEPSFPGNGEQSLAIPF